MSSNDCKNEISFTCKSYLVECDKFKNLEETLREVSDNIIYLEEAVKELQEKVSLLVNKKKFSFKINIFFKNVTQKNFKW